MVWLLGSDEKIHSLVLDERLRKAGFSSVTTSEVVAFRDFLATDPSILLELEEEIGRTVDGGGTGDRKERVLPSFLMRGAVNYEIPNQRKYFPNQKSITVCDFFV